MLKRFFRWRQTKTSSLRNQITRPYTYLIMVLSIALIILFIIISYQTSLKFIRDLDLERSEYIKDEIIEFLDSPYKVNQLNIDLYESGFIQRLSPDDLRIFFVNQYKHFGNLSLVGFGTEDGTYIDVQYLDGEALYSSERNPGSDETIGWRIDQSGKIISIESEYEYDHRIRPWYSAVKENKEKESDWTPIYMTINPKSLFLSAASPVYSDSEEFLGVMVSSLSLTEIGHIIRSFHSLGNIDVYILERDGKLVASTQLDIPFNVINGDPVRMYAGDSQDEVLSTIFQSNGIEENDEELVWIGLIPYFVGVYSVNDGRGLDWQMFIVNPADEILRDMGIRLLLILSFAIITIGVGIWIGRRIGIGISKPILEIKNAANQIVLGNLKEKVIVYKDDEVGQMALSFNKLGETIYDLVNNLEEMVDERTKHLSELTSFNETILLNSPLAMGVYDSTGQCVLANEAYAQLVGSTREILAAENFNQIFSWKESGLLEDCLIALKLRSQQQREIQVVTSFGKEIWLDYIVLPTQLNGEIHLVIQFFDLTEWKQAEEKIQHMLQEKELILKEVHHRIKNNMNIILSLLSLQADEQENDTLKEILNDATGRVQSMMILYEKLYRSDITGSMSLRDYLPVLIDEIVRIFPYGESVKISSQIDDIMLKTKILSSLGIIINELVTNSMKYGFTGCNNRLISVSASKSENHVIIIYEDNGIGMPESVSFENPEGFGLQLIAILVEQINGSIIIERKQGTKFTINFEI